MPLKSPSRKQPSSFDKPATQQASHPQKQTYSKLILAAYWTGPVFIITCHLGSLLAFSTGLSVGAWLWIALLYWVRMLAITGIYHRLLTHKSYSAINSVKWIGSLIACSAGQMGPSWWKGHHDEHHLFSDQPDDPHNSTKGFWWSHYQWLLHGNFLPSKLPADIEQDKVLQLMDRLHILPPIALGLLSFAIGGSEYLAAFFVSTTMLFHGVATVNSLCHKFGSQPFQSDDRSRNNALVAFLTLGEGWHNCHHAFPWSARQGITKINGQIKYLPDPTFWFIQGLQKIGLSSKIKLPSTQNL